MKRELEFFLLYKRDWNLKMKSVICNNFLCLFFLLCVYLFSKYFLCIRGIWNCVKYWSIKYVYMMLKLFKCFKSLKFDYIYILEGL